MGPNLYLDWISSTVLGEYSPNCLFEEHISTNVLVPERSDLSHTVPLRITHVFPLNLIMAIQTVGVVGTGVIGASWTALFLARGLQVIVADLSPDTANKLKSYLESVWPALQTMGLSHGASLDNYKFVGTSLGEHYGEVDFVQEVRTIVNSRCNMH